MFASVQSQAKTSANSSSRFVPRLFPRQCPGQLPDLLGKPEPRPGRAAFAVRFFVEGGDVALEGG